MIYMSVLGFIIDNLLQNPSLIFMHILVCVLSVLLSVAHIELISAFYKENLSKKRRLLFLVAGLVFSCISRIFLPMDQRKIVFLCLLPLCIFGILNLSFYKSILISSIVNTNAVIVAFLVYNFSRFINPILVKEFPILDILIIGIGILIESGIAYFLKNRNVIFKELELESCKKKSLVIVSFFLILLLFHNFKSLDYSKIKPLCLVMLEMGIIISYLCIILMNVGVRIKSSVELKQIRFLDANNKMLNLSTNNVKKFENEFISIVQDIGGYLRRNDFEALKKFYAEMIQEYKAVKICSILNPNTINESAIYNILCAKYYIAKKKGIDVDLKVKIDFTKLKIKMYELSRILGILLDNAIEASLESDEKKIYLDFTSESNRDVIMISNTYNQNKEIDFNKLFDKGYSTKENNTGLGLWKGKQVLLKNTNLDVYKNKNENMVIQ